MHRDDRDDPAPPSDDDGRSRRAGWFAVAATSVALTAIMIAATRIAGPDGTSDRLDGFPGPPTGGLLTVEPPRPAPSRDVAGPTAGTDVTATDQRLPDITIVPGRDRDGGSGGGGGGGAEVDGGGGGEAEPGDPPRTASRTGVPPVTTRITATAEPTASVVPPVSQPSVAADALVNATISFYDLLPHDVEGAWQLVGGTVRAKGYAAFAAMWNGVASVTITDMRVTTDSKSVQVITHVVRVDGTDAVEKYDLVFRDTGRLVIEQLSKPPVNRIEPAR